MKELLAELDGLESTEDIPRIVDELTRLLQERDKAQLNATNAAVAWQRTVKELQERILELETALKTIAEIATGGLE